jgi:hypothetical protein
MTDQDIDRLIGRWREEAGPHSFAHTILKGEAFERLAALGDRLVPFLLRRLQAGQAWMGYQHLLRRLSGADIWEGRAVAPGWRGYDVAESAKAWVRWGVERGLIEEVAAK